MHPAFTIPSPPELPVAARRRATAGACFEATIVSPQPFLGNHDEVIRLSDGSLWVVQFEYSYLYEYSPSVVVCPASGKLHVGGTSLTIQPVGPRVAAPAPAIPPGSSGVVESRVDGSFEGWSGETVVRLQNGHIWQQARYAYRYVYRYAPRVTILPIGGRYEMMVEGVDGRMPVVRLR